tara:strand:- start:79 stop:405 length:327 start_codon:yes stop_codon:yes gene_type:complete
MAKKEKVVDLKPKVEKISKEHLSKLQNLVNTINSIQFNVGKMEMQKQMALKELMSTQEEVSLMQDLLLAEYGSYDVNITDGTINWNNPVPKRKPAPVPNSKKPVENEK